MEKYKIKINKIEITNNLFSILSSNNLSFH